MAALQYITASPCHAGGSVRNSCPHGGGARLDRLPGQVDRFDWSVRHEEVFSFVTDEVREVGLHVLGRRLHETMLYDSPLAGSSTQPRKNVTAARAPER